MKQLTFAVPNSVTDVVCEIEDLREVGKLSELSCRLLQMFYVTGWDDGFIQFIGELEALCLVMFRIADNHEVAEVIALSTPALGGTAEICWWQYYRVECADFWFDLSDDSRNDT